MGDVLSLIEKVQTEVDEKKALELQEKIEQNEFTLEDFRDQLKQVKKLGSLDRSFSTCFPAISFKGMPKMTPGDDRADGERAEEDRSDHQFDDSAGARKTSDHQRFAPPPIALGAVRASTMLIICSSNMPR